MNGDLTFGQRLRLHRVRAGMSRPVLGGQVGRSAEWVKAVETGRLGVPRLPMLLRLTEILGISDLSELTGDQSLQPSQFVFGQHPAVPAIRAVVQRYTLTAPTAEPQDRRAAHAAPADGYRLAQHMLVNAAEPELQWLLVERAMTAARIADEPLTLAGSSWTVGNMLRMAGRSEEALALVDTAAALLDPYLPDAGDDWLGMWGALHLHAAARAGRDGDAWAYWDRAADAARALPEGYSHPWTAFGEANVRLHSLSLNVDLWKSREALRRAEAIEPASIPSRERRGRLSVELARGHHANGGAVAATHLLLPACDEGTNAVRYSPAARTIVEALTANPPKVIREDVRRLAARIGIDPV